MKTVNVEKTETETWLVGEWGEVEPDCVVVTAGFGITGWRYVVRHESDIPDHWPDKVKEAVRAEVMARRPLAENEVRAFDTLYSLRWHKGQRQIKFHSISAWGSYCGFTDPRAQDRAEAWFEANDPREQWQPVEGAPGYRVRLRDEKTVEYIGPDGLICAFYAEWASLPLQEIREHMCSPASAYVIIVACCKLLGVEREAAMTENQILFEHVPIELRWHNGSPEKRCSGGPWFPWLLGLFGDLNDSGDAWFRKHCPIDRFITGDGRLLEFRMRDEDGEAEALRGNEVIAETMPGAHAVVDWNVALYRFRDAERARWTTRKASDDSYVKVSGPGESDVFILDADGWSWTGGMPTWVRHKAEVLLSRRR